MESPEASTTGTTGQGVPGQVDGRALPFHIQDNATQTSFAELPSGTWETRLHGSCPECHHFHVSVPLKISRQPGVYSGVRCRKCGYKWFGLGGSSARLSLVSQETLPRSFTVRSVAAAESEPICSDTPSMPFVMSLANSMRSMSAIGSPPLAAVMGSSVPSPVATRYRSQSQSSAPRRQSGASPTPLLTSRHDSRLLSPIDCGARVQQSVSEPQSPILGAQLLQQSPIDTTPPSRQRSIKEKLKGSFSKVVGKFGYEFKKIERSKSVPPRDSEARNGQQSSGAPLQRPHIIIPESSTQQSPPPLVTESPRPRTPLMARADEEAYVEYRQASSGNPPSALEIALKRKELTARASRKCHCSEDCRCQKASPLNVPGFTLSTVAAQYSDSTTFDGTTPAQAGPSTIGPRASFELGHMEPHNNYLSPSTHDCLCSCPEDRDQRFSTADTLRSESTMSLESAGEIDQNDQNLQDLLHELIQIAGPQPEPPAQQPAPQTPQPRMRTDTDSDPEASSRHNESRGSDRTPTNRNPEIEDMDQNPANWSEIDSMTAAIGSVRSSCSEQGFSFRRESMASVTSVG